MNNRQRPAIHIAFMLIGAGVGAIAAKLVGASSWPDAKLYLVGGVGLGAAAAELVHRLIGARK